MVFTEIPGKRGLETCYLYSCTSLTQERVHVMDRDQKTQL